MGHALASGPLCLLWPSLGFPGGAVIKNIPTCQFRRHKRHGFDFRVGKMSWSKKRQPTPVFLPGKLHWQEPGGLQPMGSQRVRHYWACTHTSLLHMMFPRPKMLEYLYTHAHTHKHTHTSFHRLAHLSGASSSGELPWLYLCPLELCSLLLLCDTRTLWTSHFNVIAVYSVKCLSQNGVN